MKNKVDAIDTSGFVTRTKFATDTNALDDKIDKVEKKVPDISGVATKSSVTRLIIEQEDYTDKVKKKIPDISDRRLVWLLVSEYDCGVKYS